MTGTSLTRVISKADAIRDGGLRIPASSHYYYAFKVVKDKKPLAETLIVYVKTLIVYAKTVLRMIV